MKFLPSEELRALCRSSGSYLEGICNSNSFWIERFSEILGFELPRFPPEEVDYANLGWIISPHYIEFVKSNYGDYNYAEIMFSAAAGEGYLLLLPVLIKNGVDLVKLQPFSIFEASLYGHDEIVKFILDNVPKTEHSYPDSALHSSARIGHVTVLSLLLDDRDSTGHDGYDLDILLGDAVWGNRLDTTTYLLERAQILNNICY